MYIPVLLYRNVFLAYESNFLANLQTYFFPARRGTDSALADVSPEQELLVRF